MPPTADTAVASAGALPRHIRWFVASNALSGIFTMLTFSSSVFVLYLADLGLDKARIGFMLALFPFCGLVAPFISGWVSRFGLKATLLLFYGVRNFVMLFMLAAPWVLMRFGLHALFVYAGSVIFVFAMCRAVAETGFYPWSQEFVPDSVRGRVGGITNVVTGSVSALAMLVASGVLKWGTGIGRYQILIAVACVFGVLSVAAMFPVPGGRPVPGASTRGLWNDMHGAVRDRRFIGFLLGVGFSVLMLSVYSFLPLFARGPV